ncbi:MAG: hypothetical protein JRC99_00115 [Deltaproteobacteria bacterium]|nr:hypothetical protein [Deltaproteobacteria bacterium]
MSRDKNLIAFTKQVKSIPGDELVHFLQDSIVFNLGLMRSILPEDTVQAFLTTAMQCEFKFVKTEGGKDH